MSYPLQRASAATPSSSVAPATPLAGNSERLGERVGALSRRLPRPELALLLVLAALLYLWSLSKNGWANDYYSAAVRSMSSSWHNFLFASADPSGVMTVDKPPLALWVQSLSVRVFGYSSLSMLVPQALMGVASVGLLYDLVRRRFGRAAGFVGGLALALTPITVAISRHNNPDALLVLCCVAALWFALRALEDGRTRWLVLAGVCVGLGFETKMLVALVVVPGIALAYVLVAPRGRLRAVRQLLAGGAAMLVVGGAWPLLVALTPAADRPWISGTSDNSILSLIFEYNGVGRVDGQSGGPGGGRRRWRQQLFGGEAGPLRLLNSALGGQAGWLLGFALLSALGLLVATRLRRRDARTGWLVAVGGAFLVTAVLFSAASGIFHPYYVSLLAPFAAALVGAGAAQLIASGTRARIFAALALAAGVARELAVLHHYPGQLGWLPPVLIAVRAVAAIALVALGSRRARLVAATAAIAALLLAPSVWAVDTLGHATSSTFPEGGPANVQTAGGGMFAGRGGPGAIAARGGRPPGGPGRIRRRAVVRQRCRAAGGRLIARGRSRRAVAGRAVGRRPAAGWRRRCSRPQRQWCRLRRGRLRRADGRRSAQLAGALLRQAARRRHDRGVEPDERVVGDHRERREGRRHRWLLRARELGLDDVARTARALGRDPLGAGRTGWNAEPQGPVGRHARGLESGDHGSREGLQEGDGLDGRGHCELGNGGRRRDERRAGTTAGSASTSLYDCQGRADALASAELPVSPSRSACLWLRRAGLRHAGRSAGGRLASGRDPG